MKKSLWERFDSAPMVKKVWEHEPNEQGFRGLVLSVCPACGAKETRKTYISGFWAESHELETGMSCSMLYKCHCGAWSKSIE